MSNVKIVKFMSGQEVIAKLIDVDASDVLLTLKSPLTLQPMRDGDSMRVGLLPFSWGAVADTVQIAASQVLCIMDAEDGLAAQYLAGLAGVTMAEPRITLNG